MFFLTRPSEARIGAFLTRQRQRHPADGLPGLDEAPGGSVVDHNRIELGRGPAAFERARAALRAWAMTRVGWLEVWPPDAPIEAGTTVALLARRYGVWSLFACRIVRLVEPQAALFEALQGRPDDGGSGPGRRSPPTPAPAGAWPSAPRPAGAG
jgi:uncharacterized protein (UPF0548 family)